ncbi:hypothetical protein CAEBREN_18139 [Caenorhabditis brenneri]|uniref:DUF38 domain-containing protein n=1 Tax=Caenorhabditis brenneri TaxID=135651 RepID=G0P297_CAEBE|nr:hypothetical protein CAEBREN_18139 [Caenorhabditis brenneri]
MENFGVADVDFDKFNKYLEILDRTKVRRTSKAFRNFIDSQPLFLNEISFYSGGIDRRIEIRSNSIKTHSIIYTDNEQNTYPIELGWESRLVDREDYQKCAMEHLKLIIKTPKIHSEFFDIETYEFSSNNHSNLNDEIPNESGLFDGLSSVIDPSAKLRIKSIHINSNVLEPIVKFLSHLKPGYLNMISLELEYARGTGLSEMLELEQFKQTKRFTVFEMLFPGSIRDLLHLDSFFVDIDTFSAEDFRTLREVVFKSSTFIHCGLRVKGQFEFDGIRRELDSLVPGTSENTFRHLIPNTDDCFEISINTSGISVSRKKDYHEEDRRQMEMNNRFRRIQM